MRAFRKYLPATIAAAPETKAGAEADSVFVATISTSDVDRMGDVVDVGKLDFAAFKHNPIVLYRHNEPIGRALELTREAGSVVARFTLAGTARAREVAQLITEGVLSAVSIGFLPTEPPTWNNERGGFDFAGTELLEFSIVPIPANSYALIQRSAQPYDTEERHMDQPTPPAPAPAPAPAVVVLTPDGPLTPVTTTRKGGSLGELLVRSGLHTAVMKGAASAGDEFAVPLRAITRTLGTSQMGAAAPGIVAPVEWGGLINVKPEVPRLIDLLLSVPLASNAITYTRLTYVATTGNAAAKVAEGAAKPQSVLAATAVTLAVETHAHWIDATKQSLADVPGLMATVDLLLRSGLLDRVDAELFADLTTAGNFTAFVPVATESRADGIARVASQVALAGGSAVQVVVNPADLLAVQLAKATGSGIYLGLPPDLNATVSPAPVVPAGQVLAFGQAGAVWGDREAVNLQVGLKSDDFVKNLVTILCEARGVLMPLNPTHVAYGAISS